MMLFRSEYVCPICPQYVHCIQELLQYLLSIVVRKEKVVSDLLNNDFIVGRHLVQNLKSLYLMCSKLAK